MKTSHSLKYIKDIKNKTLDIKEQKKYLNFLGKNNFNNQYSLKKKLINSKKTNYNIWDWMKIYEIVKKKYIDSSDNNDFFNLEDSRYQAFDDDECVITQKITKNLLSK